MTPAPDLVTSILLLDEWTQLIDKHFMLGGGRFDSEVSGQILGIYAEKKQTKIVLVCGCGRAMPGYMLKLNSREGMVRILDKTSQIIFVTRGTDNKSGQGQTCHRFHKQLCVYL